MSDNNKKKVQLQDILTSDNVYPVTDAEYVEGFESKFRQLNKDDEDLNREQQEDIERLTELVNQFKNRLDGVPTWDEIMKKIAEITTEGKIDLTGYATEEWTKNQSYLKSNMLIPITLDEYNRLDEEDEIDRDAWYFIIDRDDKFFTEFNKVKETAESAKEFTNQFPIDNHVYGILDRRPRFLVEIDGSRGDIEQPSDDNNVDDGGSENDNDDNTDKSEE